MLTTTHVVGRHCGRLGSLGCQWNGRRHVLSASRGGRSFASLADDDKDKDAKSSSINSKNKTASTAKPTPSELETWGDRFGKGVGQVIFLGSSKSGGVLLASLAVGDPYLAALAATGTMASTGTAYMCGMNRGTLDAGLLAYNGCLIGCAAGGFLVPIQYGLVTSTLWTLALAPATTFAAAALPKVTGSVPQWTWAFNAVALSQFLHVKPLAVAAAASASATATAATTSPLALAAAPLVGLSQIFVVNSAVTGVGVEVAIAMYSPLLAAHALMGSSLGCLTGLALGAGADSVAMGLWGYNSALTSLAVGVFFQNTRNSWFLSAGGAVATAGVHAGLAAAFGSAGSPTLTLPFCIMATACHLLADTIPGLKIAAEPHSPEQNKPSE